MNSMPFISRFAKSSTNSSIPFVSKKYGSTV